MRVLSLISGGKDSCYCMLQCIAAGHTIVALGNIKPRPGIDEMDSYMYQTVGNEVIQLYSEALDLPLFQQQTNGISMNSAQTYEPSTNDEVEDLYQLLKDAREKIEFEAVSSGAILSNYQRIRVENVCSRLGLVSLAYLWQRDQKELLQEMISANIKAIVIKTASLGLIAKKVLGVDISNLFQYFCDLNEKYQLNICGEGGEYETLTLDCPIFKKRIEILDQEIIWVNQDEFAPVAFLKIKKACLVDKDFVKEELSIKKPLDFVKEFLSNVDKPINLTKSQPFCSLTCNFDDIKPKISSIEKHFWISGLVGKGKSIQQSTKQVMQQIVSLIHEKGFKIENLMKINVYINKMSEYIEFNTIYNEYFRINPPVRACVEVPLPSNIHFVMDCQGSLDDIKSLHVQSVSNWAPANIGPYSQGVLDNNLIYTSGQIGLIPGTMTLIESNAVTQNDLILRHITCVVKGLVNGNVDLSNVVVGICYTTDEEFVAQAGSHFVSKVKGDFKGLLICVVVGGLPRNVDVEWQVIAGVGVGKGELSLRDVEIENGVVKMENCYFGCDQFVLLRFFGNNNKGKLDLDDLKKGFELVGKDFNVGFAQVFSTGNDLQFDDVIGDLYNDCCVSVVPVVRFESSDCLLVIYLHGIK